MSPKQVLEVLNPSYELNSKSPRNGAAVATLLPRLDYTDVESFLRWLQSSNMDTEYAHEYADLALLACLGHSGITQAFLALQRWYS